MTVQINIIPQPEFERVRLLTIENQEKLSIIADMCRINTLNAVKRAGSGHLGSSFSAMDIVVWLYYHEMNTVQVGLDDPNRDIYFSSKGHDVPGLYSVLFSLGVISEYKLLNLRRLGGLDGHPDVGVSGIESNSGSLGMGISKGRGMAWAKKYLNRGGRVFVLTGDGELQEGQNYEALQTTVHQKISNLTVIVDHNKVQSDKLICEIVDIGDLERKFKSFGWHVAQCNGHDLYQFDKTLKGFNAIHDQPKLLIANTIKGQGISFMEHTRDLPRNQGLYRWHAGAPDDAAFEMGHQELVSKVNERLSKLDISPLILKEIEPEVKTGVMAFTKTLAGEPISQAAQVKATSVSDEYVAKAFGEALVEVGKDRPDLVVLDADLAADCRLRSFEATFPERFIENGIAEQDMVSMAGGLARQGLLPVVNSFASFLASRSNEQIYNNATEKTKIIYVCHYAGLIPAGPGKSHQSIRDISLFGALPNMEILQPCNAAETKMVLNYCVNQTQLNSMIRLIIGPSPHKIQLPEDYQLTFGKGIPLSKGEDALLFAYGPVMLHEALLASEMLAERNYGLKVVDMPWLNRVDRQWLATLVQSYKSIYILEDHAPVGGLGDFLLNNLSEMNLTCERHFQKFAVEGFPACGTPIQALQFHALDGLSLATRIYEKAQTQ